MIVVSIIARGEDAFVYSELAISPYTGMCRRFVDLGLDKIRLASCGCLGRESSFVTQQRCDQSKGRMICHPHLSQSRQHSCADRLCQSGLDCLITLSMSGSRPRLRLESTPGLKFAYPGNTPAKCWLLQD